MEFTFLKFTFQKETTFQQTNEASSIIKHSVSREILQRGY